MVRTLSVTMETAVCPDINISMTSNLCRLSLCVFSPCVSVLQPVTPPAGNLMSKQRAQLTFDPCMFRRPRETDWCYHRQRQRERARLGKRLVSPLGIIIWAMVDLGSKISWKHHISVCTFFNNPSVLFVCVWRFQTRRRRQPDFYRTVKRSVCSRR